MIATVDTTVTQDRPRMVTRDDGHQCYDDNGGSVWCGPSDCLRRCRDCCGPEDRPGPRFDVQDARRMAYSRLKRTGPMTRADIGHRPVFPVVAVGVSGQARHWCGGITGSHPDSADTLPVASVQT